MKCPYCNAPLMGNMQICPKCKFDPSYPDGGPKHKEWLILNNPEGRKKAEEAANLAAKQAKFDQANAEQFSDSTFKNIAISKLKQNGLDGYYEYSARTLVDEGGRTNIAAMVTLLNEMGLAGWRLVTSHTNELGKNALAIAGFGSNSTADETVLIFERYVKL